MKSKIKDRKERLNSAYPKLMVHNQQRYVVLFTEVGEGTRLTDNNDEQDNNTPVVGIFYNKFKMSEFEDFKGVLKLRN